jgi:hypothetical protein
MSATAEDITYKRVSDFAGGVGNAVGEIARLFPDSALFGSIVLYLITQHLPYGVFALFLLESAGLYKAINLITDSISDRPSPKQGATPEQIKNCRPGFLAPRLEPDRTFMHEGLISMPMFYMTATIAYLLGATMQFAAVLNTMGASWSSRTLVSIIFAILLLVLCYLRNMGCSSHLSLMGAVVLGAGAGVFFWFVNSRVFGNESMNFAGLPYLTDKAGTSSVLYACVPKDVGA